MDLQKYICSNPSKWDVRFLKLASHVSSWSEDKSRQVGSIIVGPANDIRAIGFNGLPRSVNSAIESRHTRESGEKYYWFEHAERNAIYNAARAGVMTYDCTMYSSLFPCAECMRAIIQCGIKELCSSAPPKQDQTFSRSYEVAVDMANEGNICLRLFRDTIA